MNPTLCLCSPLFRPLLRQSQFTPRRLHLNPYSTRTPIPPPSESTKSTTNEETPRPLSQRLGLPYPPEPLPKPTGTGWRSLGQLRADLSDPEQHLAKREYLEKELSKSYFRDLSRLSRENKGKTFIAPQTLFRSDKALWFPYLRGETLVKKERDTTDVLRGRVSLLAVFSGTWAERQVGLWGLDEVAGMAGGVGEVQRVDVNVEENFLKYRIIMMFRSGIRKKLEEERWGRYFIVKEGLDDEVRSAMGYHNSKVGYVYLLDEECRIRWAGSGPPWAGERDALTRGAKKLVADSKKKAEEGKGGVKRKVANTG